MPRRKHSVVGGWFANQMWNTSLPWLLGLFFIGAGFYYITNATLANHSAMLIRLEKSASDNRKEDALERSKVREAFLVDSKATAAGIAELNKQTAVMGASMLMMQKEVEKIAQRLEAPVRR